MVLGVDGHDRAQQWSLAALEDRVVRYRDLERLAAGAGLAVVRFLDDGCTWAQLAVA